MARTVAIILGLALLAVGVLGFFPEFVKNNMLFGYFAVNTAHNVVHLISGVIVLFAGIKGKSAAKGFLIFAGLVYGVLAILGFMYGEGMLFDFVVVNTAGTWLHAALAVVLLYFGLACTSCKQ